MRQKGDKPTPKHKRQLTTLQVILSSREDISHLNIDLQCCNYSHLPSEVMFHPNFIHS